MVEVHEVVVDGVLRGVSRVGSQNFLHVVGRAPAAGGGVYARDVVKNKRLKKTRQTHTHTHKHGGGDAGD